MRKTLSVLLCAALIFAFFPVGAGTVRAEGELGDLPESMYLQPTVGKCSSCGAPIFERDGDWAEDTRCYTCWAIDRNEYSHIQWTPPRPYCVHCGNSTLGNISGYCDDCIMAACGDHTQTVIVKDKESGTPIAGAAVNGGALQNAKTDAEGKASVRDGHMHLDGTTKLEIRCDGYRSQSLETTVLKLSETQTVELEKLPDTYTIPVRAVEFAAEAFGPVALDAAAQLDFRPMPLKVANLMTKEITLQRNPETGDYIGTVKMDELAKLLFDGKITLTGNVTARWSEQNSRMELVSSDVTASVKMSGDIGRVFGGVSGELTPQIRLVGVNDESGELTLVPTVSCSGSVYAYLGSNLGHTFNIGGIKVKLEAALNGGVEFQMQAQLANGQDVFQDFLQLTGNLKACAKFVGWEREWTGYHWQYYPVVEEPVELPKPVDRFLGRYDTGTSGEDSQKFDPDASPTIPAPGGSPVVEDSGSQADPVIVPTGSSTVTSSGSYGGTAVMFWIQDAKDRQEINRYRLVYSRYDGQSWSEPVPVHDDGTADFAPRALHVGDTTYILWQNADKEFTDMVSAEEYTLSMDLYAAVLQEGRIQEVMNLSEGIDGYCGLHTLSLENGKVTAAWAANDSGELLFSQGNNTGYTAVYEKGGWKVSKADIQMVSQQQNAPEVQLLAAGGTNADEDSKTVVEAAGIQFYRTNDGSLVCVEQGDERILASDIHAPVFEAAENDGMVFLYWLRTDDEGAFRMDGMFYNAKTGQASEPQTYLDHGTALYEISASMDEKGTVLLAYQSSEWENMQQGTFASSGLMTAVVAWPDGVAGGGLWWLWLTVAGAAVIAATGGVAIWVIRRKSR